MLTPEDKKEIQDMIDERMRLNIRTTLIELIPELFGRSLVQLKRFFIREIK